MRSGKNGVMPAALTANRHVYQPVGSAAELFRSRDPEVLLSGSAGTGKSRACLEKVHMMCMLNPGMRALLLRKTATSLTNTGIVTYKEYVAKEAIESGEVKWYGGSSQEAAGYKYGNGSVINVGGLDKATRIMSSEYDVVFVQEATELTEDDWEMITTRLRNGKVTFQQLMADANPSTPHHWLKKRCDRGATKLIYCRHEDNPRLYNDGIWTPEGLDYVSKLEALTGVRYRRLRQGQWAAADGLVYDEFDPATHLVEYAEAWRPPAKWPRYWAIDFGYTNPFTWQAWAEDPDGRLVMYREVYQTQRTVEEHCDAIISAVGAEMKECPPVAIICDHDAEGRATLERKLGVHTTAAKKDVLEGINAVKMRLKLAGDGHPRLYIRRDALVRRDPLLVESSKALCLQDEILEYIWDKPGIKDQPRKESDHAMDAMRYMVAHRDLKQMPRMFVARL